MMNNWSKSLVTVSVRFLAESNVAAGWSHGVLAGGFDEKPAPWITFLLVLLLVVQTSFVVYAAEEPSHQSPCLCGFFFLFGHPIF